MDFPRLGFLQKSILNKMEGSQHRINKFTSLAEMLNCQRISRMIDEI